VRDAGIAQLGREIARMRRTKEPLIVAIVDIDSDRTVNGVHGHRAEAGDRMLVDLAVTLRTSLRSYDLIIRYGDDTFICAITGMDMSGAAKWLERVETALPQHPEHGAVSVGFAELQPGDSTDDLVARAAAALDRERRHRSDQTVGGTWKCGNLVVDELACSTTRAGSPVFLTATEFSILVLLARNHTHVVPKRQLFNRVGGYGNDYRLLEVHISSLRRKLEVYGPRVIFTIRGTGYVLHRPALRTGLGVLTVELAAFASTLSLPSNRTAFIPQAERAMGRFGTAVGNVG
jgi:diguanylate cyclase (GGDEF)-like protein